MASNAIQRVATNCKNGMMKRAKRGYKALARCGADELRAFRKGGTCNPG